jgi:hypothetical protein
MQENSLQVGQRFQGNPLEAHLRRFVTALLKDGYADATVQDKLGLLDHLGQWLRRTGCAITHLDERLVEAFVKHRMRVHSAACWPQPNSSQVTSDEQEKSSRAAKNFRLSSTGGI